MTGTIVSIPPTVELPPGSNASNPASLPGFTYQFAVTNLPQTWTAKQTFALGNISIQAGDIGGLASSATIDATNASNITSGTLASARLPTPTATTLGGVKSLAAVASRWINSIDTLGNPTQLRPDAVDVSFTATSGTLRTIDSRLKDVYSVLDYGADPTGATDSAPAFRTAIAAVPYGGTLWIPAGSYLLNSSVNGAILDFTNFPNKGITLRGVGWQLKVGADYTTPSGSILKIGSAIPNTVDFYRIAPTQQVTGMGFRDFAVIPAGGVYSQPYGRYGIHIDTSAGTTGYVNFLYVDNIFIDNFAAGWGFYVHGIAGGNTLISSVIQNSSFMTTKFVNIADSVTFSNNIYGANALTYVSAATVAAGGSGGTNGAQTVTVSGGTGTAATLNVTVTAGAITAINSVTSGGFYSVFPISPAAVTGAGLVGATVNLTQLFPNIGIDASQVNGATSLRVIGNNFVSQDGAIKITNALAPVIRDNEIEQNAGNNTSGTCINVTSTSNVAGGFISGNLISVNSSSVTIYPIFVGAAQGTTVLANTIYVPTTGTHVFVSASATNIRVLYNTCYVNGLLVNNGTYGNSGVGTVIVDNATVNSFNSLVGAVATSVVVQKFTATGTYTPTAGMLHAIIECWGGGGGGGGTATATTNIGIGGGGGQAGGYSRKYVLATDIGASKPVTIGAAGSAGAIGNFAGGNGGDTSVGVLCVAKGGIGGAGSAGSGDVAPGAGTVAGTGDITTPGAPGISCPGQSGSHSASGGGGSSLVGMGGAAVASATAATGSPGTGFASGGSGGQSFSAGGAAAGGAGTAGYVVITEFVNL